MDHKTYIKCDSKITVICCDRSCCEDTRVISKNLSPEAQLHATSFFQFGPDSRTVKHASTGVLAIVSIACTKQKWTDADWYRSMHNPKTDDYPADFL